MCRCCLRHRALCCVLLLRNLTFRVSLFRLTLSSFRVHQLTFNPFHRFLFDWCRPLDFPFFFVLRFPFHTFNTKGCPEICDFFNAPNLCACPQICALKVGHKYATDFWPICGRFLTDCISSVSENSLFLNLIRRWRPSFKLI